MKWQIVSGDICFSQTYTYKWVEVVIWLLETCVAPYETTEEYEAIVLYDFEAKEAVQLSVYEKDIIRIRKVAQMIHKEDYRA